MAIPFGGNQVTVVPPALAEAYSAGDSLIVVQESGDLLHIPVEVAAIAEAAVGSAYAAFSRIGTIDERQITAFYRGFADRLADDQVFEAIATANLADVERAKSRGRSSTRLVLSTTMRSNMIDGLHSWADQLGGRETIIETIQHQGWAVDQVKAGLGVVGFIFEGRPNVFADATGVLRSGNTVVFRIGSDALGTARSIMKHALEPALIEAGLPAGAVTLLDSPERSAGWAMFSDRRLALAVARGSGPAVSQLGAVARQSGVPVSLHGTGGAWLVTSSSTAASDLTAVVANSLDRKVCNTLNTCCLLSKNAPELVIAFLNGLERAAAAKGTQPKLHVTSKAGALIPDRWWSTVEIARAGGPVAEPQTEAIDEAQLGQEWEWEESPEVSLCVVESIDEAVSLFNRYSPRFIASLLSSHETEHERFFASVDAPFVGNGFTRWVDGQYALDRPELGLSNWNWGRLLGRGGVLSGDSVFTVRSRMRQLDVEIHR